MTSDDFVDSTDSTGLHEKYRVTKDGKFIDECFVLEPEDDVAARVALAAYAEATNNEQLAADLRGWLDTIRGGQP